MERTKRKHVPWTAEENSKLLQNWEHASREELLAMFPGHNMHQLSVQARALRIQGLAMPYRRKESTKRKQYNKWTDAEIEILIRNYPTMPRDELLALLPGHNWYGLSSYVQRLRAEGVDIPARTVGRTTAWTEEENKILIENWANSTMDELLAKLPGRTRQECQDHVQRLKAFGVDVPTRRWSLTIDNYEAYFKMGHHAAQKSAQNNITGVHRSTSNRAWAAAIEFYKKRRHIIQVKNKSNAIAARKRVDKALEPIYAELQRLAETNTVGDKSKYWNEIVARGHQIIETEIRQIRAEHKAAKS